MAMTSGSMPRITRDSLLTLEAYSRQRSAFRAEVMAHKKLRKISLGEHVTLIFEDELTVRYQIQEMLRAERIFEEDLIQDELDAYNPLVPDGRNFKATMMIEFPDPEERRVWLGRLIGIEDKTWVQVEGCKKVWAIADEDLERDNGQKTSAVHFLRFELTNEMAAALKYGVALSIGIDHPAYAQSVVLSPDAQRALAKDLY
jgi:hypothetical protein